MLGMRNIRLNRNINRLMKEPKDMTQAEFITHANNIFRALEFPGITKEGSLWKLDSGKESFYVTDTGLKQFQNRFKQFQNNFTEIIKHKYDEYSKRATQSSQEELPEPGEGNTETP